VTEVDGAVAWAEAAWGRRVASSRRLRGGVTSTMLALTSDHGSQSVLRLMTEEPWRRHADALLSRESLVQTQLADSDVPAPRSIALDATGDQAGVPAHLMSHLPGALELNRDDDGQLEALAALLTRIHAIDPGDGGWPRTYQSWAWPDKRIVPEWSERSALWRRAFAVLDGEPPTYEPTFLHRDFHPGNVLWEGDVVSGVVDWVETSTGPAALDVAHCMTGLVLLHGVDAATRFAQYYRRASGRDVAGSAYWWVMDVVGSLPGPQKVTVPWRESGRSIDDALAYQRLEAALEAALVGLDSGEG
jgi:aminoglycoside phosphotransferase (APT) family kinase protein